MTTIIISLSLILLVTTIVWAWREKIKERDLKKQITKHDENSYS